MEAQKLAGSVLTLMVSSLLGARGVVSTLWAAAWPVVCLQVFGVRRHCTATCSSALACMLSTRCSC